MIAHPKADDKNTWAYESTILKSRLLPLGPTVGHYEATKWGYL